jgi:hypothetical protein
VVQVPGDASAVPTELKQKIKKEIIRRKIRKEIKKIFSCDLI